MSAGLWILIALAGGCGAACRFLVDGAVGRRVAAVVGADDPRPNGPRRHWLATRGVPLGTIAVNVSACFLLGLLTGWAKAAGAPSAVTSVLGTGFLGGYSTFSTASVEGARLLLAGRFGAGLAHAVGMAVLSLAAVALGLLLGGALG